MNRSTSYALSASQSLFGWMFTSPDPVSGSIRLRTVWRILLHLLLAVSGLVAIQQWALPLLIGRSPILSSLAELLVVTLSVYLARHWFDRRSFRSLGLHRNAQSMLDLAVGLALPALVFGQVYLLFSALGWIKFEGYAWDTQSGGAVVQLLFMGFLGFIFAGWTEELMSRGYWLQNLREGLNLPMAVLISSSIFGVLHLSNPNASIIAALNLVLFGLLLAFAYLRTRRLWLPVGLHIGWNFFQGNVFGFPVSGFQTFRLLKYTVQGPEAITGGKFGPEGGWILLPMVLFLAIIIALYSHRQLVGPTLEKL